MPKIKEIIEWLTSYKSLTILKNINGKDLQRLQGEKRLAGYCPTTKEAIVTKET